MFSALLNAQNRTGTTTIPITSVTWSIPSNQNSAYTGSAQSVSVVSVSPPGATYSTSTTTATNAGGVASTTITGSGIYTGSFTSPTLTITQATITATNSNFFEGAFQPDTCNNFQAVAGFNITLGGIAASGLGVPVSVLYGTSFAGATLCSVSANINIEGVVSSLQGSSPYQNRVYTTNGLTSFFTNFNNIPAYFWCVVNSSTFGGASYNANYTTAILSNAGVPGPFYNSCQT
jgi:hypothetical protein